MMEGITTDATKGERMQLSFEDHDCVLIVRPKKGTLTADRLDHTKRMLVERIHEKRLVAFDLSKVRYMNSTALSLLLTVLKAIHGEGDVRLFAVPASVREFLRLTRMDRVLAVDPDEETAIANLRESQETDLAA